MKSKIDPTRLGSVDPTVIGPIAYALVNEVQDQRPEEQAVAYALTFITICKRLRVHPTVLMQAASNVLKRADLNKAPEIRALLMYTEGEL